MNERDTKSRESVTFGPDGHYDISPGVPHQRVVLGRVAPHHAQAGCDAPQTQAQCSRGEAVQLVVATEPRARSERCDVAILVACYLDAPFQNHGHVVLHTRLQAATAGEPS